MNKQILYLFCFSCLFYSCAVNRALPAEKPLFPDKAAGKWWIINSTGNDRSGKAIHFSALISFETLQKKNYAGCFVSVWSQADSSFHSNVQNEEISSLKFKETFPLKLTIPGDTAIAGWHWKLKRDRLVLETNEQKNGKQSLSGGFMNAEFDFVKQDQFNLYKLNAAADIWMLDPFEAGSAIWGRSKKEWTGPLFLRVFSGRTALLSKAKNNFVHWLDLVLLNGKKISVLYTTDNAGKINAETTIMWDEKGNRMLRPLIEIKSIKPDFSVKNELSKPYPLFFSFLVPGSKSTMLIRPRIAEQEVRHNKSSFWMGAIEVIDEQTGRQQGMGNMLIFRQ